MKALEPIKMPNGIVMPAIEYYARCKVFAEKRADDWYKFAKRSAAKRDRIQFLGDAKAFKHARDDIREFEAKLVEFRRELFNL